MRYVLKHKEYKTFYCFDKDDKFKHYKLDVKKAYKFNKYESADKMRNRFKHPDNWEIIKVKEVQERNAKEQRKG